MTPAIDGNDPRWPKRRADVDDRALGRPVTGRCLFHPGAARVGTLADVREWFRQHECAEHRGGGAALHVTAAASPGRAEEWL
jgi:hypothetical protein